MASNLYTISATESMADILAQGLYQRFKADPLALAAGVIYVPTRRSVLSLRDAFFQLTQQLNSSSILLPRIVPLGDVMSDGGQDFDLATVDLANISDFRFARPIAHEAQLLILAKLLRQSGFFKASHSQFLHMAQALSGLLDELMIAKKDITALSQITVDEEYAQHWQRNLMFLQDVLLRQWSGLLHQMGMCHAIDYLHKRLELEAKRVQNSQQGWFLAAGSTGSRPAIADFLACLLAHPNGEVILPDFANNLSAETYQAILDDYTHPQHIMVKNIMAWKIAPQTIMPWSSAKGNVAENAKTQDTYGYQQSVLNFAFRSVKDEAKPKGAFVAHALQHVELVECDTSQQEAWVIALMMRQGIAEGKRTVLVVADHELARRVTQILRCHYGIWVQASQGLRLDLSPAGRYLLLLSQAWQTNFRDDTVLLSLLQHPFSCFGHARAEILPMIRKIQKQLRKQLLDGGVQKSFREELHQAFSNSFRWQPFLGEEPREEPREEPGGEAEEHTTEHQARIFPLQMWLDRFIALAQMQTIDSSASGAPQCFSGADGKACYDLLMRTSLHAQHYPPLNHQGFGEVLRFFLVQEIYRPQRDYHPDIEILGSWESRMISAQRVIIGGLCENVWPKSNSGDLWFNRDMRKQLGLGSPEIKIGLAAHDFLQNLQKNEVFLTRARQNQGSVTLESRFLTRLKVTFPAWAQAQTLNNRWVQWQIAAGSQLAKAERLPKITAPDPKPDIAYVPRELHVTEIEKWMRDPYGLYARKILTLQPLTHFFTDTASIRFGLLVHKILECSVHDSESLAIQAEKWVGQYIKGAGRQAVARVRLQNIIAFVSENYDAECEHFSEISGEAKFITPDGHSVIVRGRADSIRLSREASISGLRITIIDYKTGEIPSISEQENFQAPQMPWLQLILQQAGFDLSAYAGQLIIELAYWQLKPRFGKSKIDVFLPKKSEPELAEIISDYQQNWLALWDDFLAGRRGFQAIPDRALAPKYNDYAHLARHKEWGE